MTILKQGISEKLLGFYLIWIAVHLILLLTIDNTLTYKSELWPFMPSHTYYSRSVDSSFSGRKYFDPLSAYDKSSYDYSEFIIYTIIPLILFGSYYLISKNRKSKSKSVDGHDSSLDLKEIDVSNEKNIEKMLIYSGQSAIFNLSYNNLGELKYHSNAGYLMFRQPDKYDRWGFVIKGCDEIFLF